MKLDARIDGAWVVRPWGEPEIESVGVVGDRIVAVGDLRDLDAVEVIELDGAYLLPGAIDTHVHIGFTDTNREVSTETESAAIGGVTTALVYFRSLESYDELVPDFLDLMARQSSIDFAVHLGILTDYHLEHLDEYISRWGIRSIKMYTTYKSGELRQYGILGQDDGFILDCFRAAARHPDLVVNVHCENDDMIRRGQVRWRHPDSHPVEQWSEARPPIAEAEAIQRVGLLARRAGNHLYIPHLSSAEALDAALMQRQLGAHLTIETCAHYLLAGELAEAGVSAKVNPPVRTAADAARLYQAIRSGDIDTVGTDHAARMWLDKDKDVVDAAPGNPGIGVLVPALLDSVARKRLSLTDVARVQLNAARIFGLQGKGILVPGAAADIVAVDMSIKRPVRHGMLRAISDFSPYEGLELQGWPILTMLAGKVIARDGSLMTAASGRYLRPEYAPVRTASA